MSVTAETAAKPVGNHVFISYSKTDVAFAETICSTLESAGVKCWMAPRDILPGAIWGEAIIDAIVTSRMMILVFSRAANKSNHVSREVERAASHGVPLLQVRIEDVKLAKSLELYLSTSQWLDAFTAPREKHLDRLVASVQKLLETAASEGSRRSSQGQARRVSATRPSRHSTKATTRLIAGVLGGIAVLGGSAWALSSVLSGEKSPPSPVVKIVGWRQLEHEVGDAWMVGATVDGGAATPKSGVRWRSSDTAVMRIYPDAHEAVAVAPGTAILFAELPESRDSVLVTIRPKPVVTPRPATVATLRLDPPRQLRVGDSLRLAVRATDSAGQPLAVQQVTWRTSSARVAVVDSAKGVLRAVAPGRATITASVGSSSATVIATVVERAVVTRPLVAGPSATDLRGAIVTQSAPSPPALTPAISRAFAEKCIAALRSGDRQWLSAHYGPETALDADNLRSLDVLVGRRGYAAQEIALSTSDPLTTFKMRLSYTNSFGNRRSVDAMFTVGAAWFNEAWVLKSCRISGTLRLP